jgi:radical SAM superfamily enzyme YgiQ (UPF0313 family)
MIDVALMTAPTCSPLSIMASRYAGTPPLGLAYLAAALRREGYRVNIVDMNLRSCTRRYLRRFLEVKEPRLVGISSLTESFPNAVRMARVVKKASDRIKVIIGGPHVSFTPRETLAAGPFDFVVVGEGEAILVELAGHLLRGQGAWQEIAGLWGREASRILGTPPRRPAAELDEMLWPARELLFLEEYPHAGALLTSRGCSSGCIFCSAGAMSGGRCRRRSVEDVVAEIETLSEMGISSLMFLDDSLTADLGRLDRILYRFRKADISVPWACESRVDIEDPRFIQRMAQAGCYGVQFGVESGSPAVLARLGKGIDLDQVCRSVGEAVRAGINPVCSLMIGLPWDTASTVRQTIDFAVSLQQEFAVQVGISIATPFPGTAMFRHAERLGLEIQERDYAMYNLYTPVMRTRHLTREEIRNLHFESLDRLRRNLPTGMTNLFPALAAWNWRSSYDYREELC